MKSLLSIIGAILLYINVQAQITPEWVRYPAISPNGSHIVFTYKGDLYVTSSTGGEEVKRLTFHTSTRHMIICPFGVMILNILHSHLIDMEILIFSQCQ